MQLEPLRGFDVADVGMAGQRSKGLLYGWYWSCQKSQKAEATPILCIGAMLTATGKIMSSFLSTQLPVSLSGSAFAESIRKPRVRGMWDLWSPHPTYFGHHRVPKSGFDAEWNREIICTDASDCNIAHFISPKEEKLTTTA